jgi:glycogen debranching enzyme
MANAPTTSTSDDMVSPFYIPSVGAMRSYRARTLKNHDTFVVLDSHGDAQAVEPASEGLFHEDTRFLSHYVMLINGERPLLLSSTVTRNNEMLAVDLTNPDFFEGERLVLERDTLHLLRRKVLSAGGCFEEMVVRSYADRDVSFELSYGFGADFADIFEVRGKHRERRGQMLPDDFDGSTVVLGYRGLDGVTRQTQLSFDPAPSAIARRQAHFAMRLPPGGSTTLYLSVRCKVDGRLASGELDFASARTSAQACVRRQSNQAVQVHTSNAAFNSWLDRSSADLDMLVTEKETGPYPYAGIPWFSTPFGRDGIIAALESLWVAPRIAKGVLAFLAATQATEFSEEMDAEPGKILHETRRGEMAILGEVPFARYYGSIDSTPLFIMLAEAYHERTGDLAFIRSIWPNIEAALSWMNDYGDRDGDGFLEYDRQTEKGLRNQGWKDSNDSIFHADGRLADLPIALVEVQAYAYAAWRGAARLAGALGHDDRHDGLMQRAYALQETFERTFWCEEIDTYALALDGAKRPCRVRSSNAGHALFTGIASPARAARVAATLMDITSFSDWGIRTVATTEARYNPMSYHNGSVWPHDNGLIAMGFVRYGLRDPMLKLLTGLYEAARSLELYRLPELFCGFPRRDDVGPTSYPVACIPQAWSSASAFALLGSALGISFHPAARQIRFTRPVLPAYIDTVRLEHVRMGDVSVDLIFRRHNQDASLHMLRKEGEVEIVQISG